MNVTTERQENCIVKLTISVEEDKETEYLRRSARALSREYRIRGFRPGKAPYNVVVQRLGIEMVRGQVVEQFGDEVFEQGLKESGLEPVALASLENVTWDPFTLHVSVPVGPEVLLGDYRDIRIRWGAPEVTDEALAEELARLQKQQSEWEGADRPAELGDQVVLNITGKVDDDVVLENTDRELVLSASSPYPVPGFAEAVVGMEAGQTKAFTLTYPEDHYNAEIAGREGHFEVTLNQIRTEVMPELDDEFAMTVGDYEDLEDLKTKVRASLLERAETAAEREYQEQIWEKLLETATVEYPEVLVDQETDQMKTQLEQQLQQQQMDLDSYFKLTNTTEEAWKAQTRPQAEERLRRALILGELIKQEELTVDAAEIDAEIEEMVAPLGEQAEQIREMFSSPQGRASIGESLLTGRALEQMKAIARGEDPPKGGKSTEPAADAEADADEGSEAITVADEGAASGADVGAEAVMDAGVEASIEDADADVEASYVDEEVSRADTEAEGAGETAGGEEQAQADVEAVGTPDAEASSEQADAVPEQDTAA